MNKEDNRPIILILSLAVFLLALSFIHDCEMLPWKTKITGTIESVSVEGSGRADTFAVVTRTDRYLVAEDAFGEDLSGWLNKRVRVKGRLTEDEKGQKIIHISDCEAIH